MVEATMSETWHTHPVMGGVGGLSGPGTVGVHGNDGRYRLKRLGGVYGNNVRERTLDTWPIQGIPNSETKPAEIEYPRSYLIRIDSIVDLSTVSFNRDSSPTPEDETQELGLSVRHAAGSRSPAR